MGDTAATPRLRTRTGLGSAVVLVPDPATALSCLLRADLILPRHAQAPCSIHAAKQ
jgi:hypothetical protein